MADVSEINLDGGYVPVSETRKKNPVALGWYPCHIVDCQVKTVKVKGKYKAKIYNPMLEVADEVKGLKFTIKDIQGNDMQVTGEDYVGYKFRSMGVFYFLNPQVGDDFEVYPKGNVGYMFGGNFIHTSDSRIPNDYPIPIHDRQETQEQYNHLSV